MRKTEEQKDKNSIKNMLKKKKGITLVALVVTIVVLIILAGVTISMVVGDNGIITKAKEAKQNMTNASAEEKELMQNMLNEMNEIESGIGGEEIDPPNPLEPLPTDGSYNETKGVNTPKLGTNMQLVKFDTLTQNWVVDETNSAYSYVDTSTSENTNKSEWANAKVTVNEIDSYFVWIPRYAYKIIGENNIDIKFLKGTSNIAADGVTVCKYANENPTADDYIIHPAFTKDANYGGGFGNNNGTNDNGIAGIWIGKYEASLANKADGTNIVTNDTETGGILLSNNTDKTVVTKPGYSSWRYCTIGNMYTNAKAYDTNLKSHMLKNSEWGTVAYLTESKYGRNGTEIGFSNEGYITGGGEGKDYAENNQNQSTTGNVYGVYDMRGGAYEYVAAGLNNQSSIGTSSGSNEYGTVYTETTESTGYKYGDATYETSGWHSANANFVNSSYPFFGRGGYYNYGESNAGVFYYTNNDGGALYFHSDRKSVV